MEGKTGGRLGKFPKNKESNNDNCTGSRRNEGTSCAVTAPAAFYLWVYSYSFNSWCYLSGNEANCYFYNIATGAWHYTNSSFWPWSYNFTAGTWSTP